MEKPKGKLVLMGGAIHKGDDDRLDMEVDNKEFEPLELLKVLTGEIKQRNSTIEIITTASTAPKEAAKPYISTFKHLGIKTVRAMHIPEREDANKEEFVERLKKANAVFFTGGDQFRLSTILGCSEVMNTIMDRYKNEEFVIAGTSAGAMAIPYTMIYEGHNPEALLMGDVHTSGGLGLLDNCIVDTHFIKRGRFGRLIHAVIANPGCVGIGLGEDTGLIVTEGNKMECYGSGMVAIIDGQHIKSTNITYVEKNTPVCVENLIVHVLSKGNGFLLKERKYLKERHPEDNVPVI